MIGKIGDDSVIIVWVDCNGSLVEHSTSAGEASFEGTLRTDAGRELKLGMSTEFRQTGNVVIDGQTFDPPKWRFFLVSTANGTN